MAPPPLHRRSLLAAAAAAGGAAFLGSSAFLGGSALFGRRAFAGDRTRTLGTEDRSSRRVRREAIQRGCAWLGKKIRPDGGFGDDKAVVALTALASLALQAGGSSFGRGPHGEQVQHATEFLLKLVEAPASGTFRPEGYFHHPGDTDSRMHGQGYAGLALATSLGSAPGDVARRIRTALATAVGLMEVAQTGSGGYGYQPSPDTSHEGSVTVCVAQALRAARDAGLTVSQHTIDRGLDYLLRSQIRSDASNDGGFKYSHSVERDSYALTAAAISSFYLFGRYVDDRNRTIERGVRYMLRALERGAILEDWFYYGHFHGSWAFWQHAGGDWSPNGPWGKWAKFVLPELIDRRQRSDGSWDDADSGRFAYGPVLATSFAVLTLSVPDEALPIFQR